MYIMIGLTYDGVYRGISFFLSYYDFIKSTPIFANYILYELDITNGTIKRVKEKVS